jgi:serine/threonine-protein kinase
MAERSPEDADIAAADASHAGEPRHDVMIGKALGPNYTVVDRIAYGGMGVVYLVEHVTLKKRFAAKILSTELSGDAEARGRFEVEAHAASKLEHENIVSVTDYGVADDGRPFLIMEHLRGRTLGARMAEGPLTLEETVAVTVPLCEALEAAHEEGFIHRDVKPENIFLTQRAGGRIGVKVLDFGITKFRLAANRLTKMGQTLGSPIYMSPEACRGEEVDSRADVYSVGVILYEMLCGRPPFQHDNLLKVLQMQVVDPVTPPRELRPDLPVALERVVCRALEKDPDDRYPNTRLLQEELMAAIPPGAERLLAPTRTPLPMASQRTPEPGSLPSIAPTPVPAPRARARHSPAVLLLTSVLFLGGIGGAYYALTLLRPPARAPAQAAPAPEPPPAPAPEPKPAAAPAPEPPAAPPVRVQVRSTPRGAWVTLDGKLLGETPVDSSVPARAGGAVLEVTQAGYQTHSTQVDLDKDVDLDVALERERARKPGRPRPTTSKPAQPVR